MLSFAHECYGAVRPVKTEPPNVALVIEACRKSHRPNGVLQKPELTFGNPPGLNLTRKGVELLLLANSEPLTMAIVIGACVKLRRLNGA